MRDHGNYFLGSVIKGFETCLTAGENCAFGEGIRVAGEVGGFIRKERVYFGEIDFWKLGGNSRDISSGIAWLVGVF